MNNNEMPKRKTVEPSSDYEHAIFAAEIGDPPKTDLHALDVHEALRTVDQFINHEFLEGSDVIKIIHGRGTGKLREAIHAFLTNHELVAYFRDANVPGQIGGSTYAVLHAKDRPSESRLKGA